VAGDVRPRGAGQFVYRQTPAVQPVAHGPGRDPAPAAERRGGGYAGAGDQLVDCPLAVGAFAAIARCQPGSAGAGFIQHRWRIFLRVFVSRFVHTLRPQLRGGRLFAVGGRVFRVVGGTVCAVWRGIDRPYSDPEHGREHLADQLGFGGPSRHSRVIPRQSRRVRGDEPDLRRHLAAGAANSDLRRGAGIAVFLPQAHLAATGTAMARWR